MFPRWLVAAVGLAVGCEAQSSSSQDVVDEAMTTGGGETGDTDGSMAMGPVDGSVTYYEHVAPILAQRCQAGCHEPGTIAPFGLQTYEEVWPIRELISVAVQERTMPPWFAAGECNSYAGDRSLSDEEIETIVRWAEEDGPSGRLEDRTDAEPPDRPGLTRVDVSLPLPEPYLPRTEPDDYRCFVMDWPETKTKFITGFEAVPGNANIVHHVITYAVDPEDVATYEALDEAEPGPGYTCYGGPGASESDWTAGRWIAAWAPGGGAFEQPASTGLRIEPGSKVIVQIHYNSLSSDGEPDQTEIRYKLEDEVELEGAMMLWANPEWLYGAMPIPAGAKSTVHRFVYDPTEVMGFQTDIVPENEPFLIYNAAHHMHVRGVRGLQKILRGDGSEECLVDLPRYDYDWQDAYRFGEPVRVEPGDQLMVECEWDNSGNDQDVNWGEGTGDEMCLAVMYITAVP